MYKECRAEKKARMRKNRDNAKELFIRSEIAFTVEHGLMKTEEGYYRFADGYFKVDNGDYDIEGYGIKNFISEISEVRG